MPDPAGAAVRGLVRSAQSENPDRLLLIDLDGHDDAQTALPALPALSAVLASGEPEVAVRQGVLKAPRLARAGSAADSEAPGVERRTVRCWSPAPPVRWAAGLPATWWRSVAYGSCSC
ncbi:hypothetical protein SANTM175S_08512 [Streptomyces antimycoticus]